MQLKNGDAFGNTTCAVVNGLNIVNAAAGSDWSQARHGAWFTISGSFVFFDLIDDASIVAGVWQIRLSANYSGATDPAADAVIFKDFGPNGEPILDDGDTEIKPLINRTFRLFASRVPGAGGVSTASSVLPSGAYDSAIAQVVQFYSLLVNVGSGISPPVTISIASPGVVTWAGHGKVANEVIKFATTGALPTGLVAGTTYYVVGASITANTFQLSAAPGGAAINTSGSQSGVHTVSVPYTHNSLLPRGVLLPGALCFVKFNFPASTNPTERVYNGSTSLLKLWEWTGDGTVTTAWANFSYDGADWVLFASGFIQ